MFLAMLLFSVLVGFAYYVGIPLYNQFYDAEAQSRHNTNLLFEDFGQLFDLKRDETVDEVVKTVNRFAIPVETTNWNFISIDAVLNDGQSQFYLHDIVGDAIVLDNEGVTLSDAFLSNDYSLSGLSYAPELETFLAEGTYSGGFGERRDLDVLFLRGLTDEWASVEVSAEIGQNLVDAVQLDENTALILRDIGANQLLAVQDSDTLPTTQKLSDTEAERLKDILLFGSISDDENVNFQFLEEVDISAAEKIPGFDLPEALPQAKLLRTTLDGALEVRRTGDITRLIDLGNGEIALPQEGGYITILDKSTGQSRFLSLAVANDIYSVGALENGGYLIGGEGGYLAMVNQSLTTEDQFDFSTNSIFAQIHISKDPEIWWAVTSSGQVFSISDKGEQWDEFFLTGDGVMVSAATSKNKLLGVQSGSGVIKFEVPSSSEAGLSLSSGSEGDQQFREYLGDLSIGVRTDERLQPDLATFNEWIEMRSRVDGLITDNASRLAELRRRGYSWQDNLEKNQRFMKNCLPDDASKQTKEYFEACTASFNAIVAQEGTNWWSLIAENAPPGILLLFLLSTSGGLYRYNLRVAGFYNSRADVLELVGETGKLPSGLNATDLTAMLALEKVEFGKASAPSDQSTKLLETILSRLPGGN